MELVFTTLYIVWSFSLVVLVVKIMGRHSVYVLVLGFHKVHSGVSARTPLRPNVPEYEMMSGGIVLILFLYSSLFCE